MPDGNREGGFIVIVPIKLPKEEKDHIVRGVQQYFEEERSETIGNLAAEQIVDVMLQLLGPYLYNKAIADARAVVLEKISQVDDELYALEKHPPRHGR